jgi:hypothetical protein
MSIAPKQEWAAYQARMAEEEAAWVRKLDTSERFAIYADLFGVIWSARQNGGTGDWDELDRWHWQHKLAIRLRCVQAFRRLDEIHKG